MYLHTIKNLIINFPQNDSKTQPRKYVQLENGVPLGVFEGFRDLKAVGRAVVAGIAGRRRRGWLVRGAVFCISSGGLKHFVHSIKSWFVLGGFVNLLSLCCSNEMGY